MSMYQSWFTQCFQQAIHAVSPVTCLTMSYLPAKLPPKVSIAEGVEIAKVFSTNDSSSFVNGFKCISAILVFTSTMSLSFTLLVAQVRA